MGQKGLVFVLLVLTLYACERKVLPETKKEVAVFQLSGQDSLQQRNQGFVEQEVLGSEIEVSNFNYWQVIAIVSILINGILIYFTRWLIQNEKKNRNNSVQGASQNTNRTTPHYDHPESLNLLKVETSSSNSKTRGLDNPMKTSVEDLENEKTVEIELSVNSSIPQVEEDEPEPEEPKVLYAEKATATGMFSDVSEKLDPHKSYFKFTLFMENRGKAEFEVLDSEFILKKGANQPDLYLYTVCDPENSNQNFTSEIITVKKGIAELANGSWQIKKGNKAKIKFQ